MKDHWKIIVWLVAGLFVGAALQFWTEGHPASPFKVTTKDSKLVLSAVPDNAKLAVGDSVVALIKERGRESEERLPVTDMASYDLALRSCDIGAVIFYETADGKFDQGALKLDSKSQRADYLRPFSFFADIFLRLLKMLIVPMILTSIITGVVGLGSGADLKRLGSKTFLYYIATSMVAIVTGLVLVNLIRPGDGASLGLAPSNSFDDLSDSSFIEVLIRMVPENVFEAFGANSSMLQVIFFSLLFGYFILKTKDPHRKTMKSFFEAAFEVMMKLAAGILTLIPYGVFCLLVKVVGQTGFAVFKPLGLYMITVFSALMIHCCITLPFVLKFFAKVNPLKWVKAVSPALITAFSTSSSSMTLPVTMETVEKRGGVSNKVVSFVQPLGATINMDGTALYECIGVIFLAQYYAGVSDFHLTFSDQLQVVLMALLASIGAAGIPSAGLIMMVTILAALKLPVEGAALLLAVDRPLDMLRTVTNVFSDTCGSAVVAVSEGETILAGDDSGNSN
ncbi:MAG: proton glutamate symport protein [Planctomycetota bacterium]